MAKWEIYIRRPFQFNRDSLQIVIGRRQDDGSFYVMQPTKMEFVRIPEMGQVDATLEINGDQTEGFLRALGDAIDDGDMRTSRSARLEGTLDAKKDHIKDLQKMLKLRPKIDATA